MTEFDKSELWHKLIEINKMNEFFKANVIHIEVIIKYKNNMITRQMYLPPWSRVYDGKLITKKYWKENKEFLASIQNVFLCDLFHKS